MKIVLRVLLALAVLALAAWFGGRGYLARSVARHDGTIRGPFTRERVLAAAKRQLVMQR